MPVSRPAKQPGEDKDEYRLPTNLKPVHYDITVRTDLEALAFDGTVKIEYVCLSSELMFTVLTLFGSIVALKSFVRHLALY